MIQRYKIIHCKECGIECKSGHRGLCGGCYAKAQKEKTKQKKVKEKRTKQKLTKKFSKTVLMKEADTVFSLFVRLRDTDSNGNMTCITSGRFCGWNSIDNSHYIPRSYMKYRYDEINCNAQSKNDNGRLHGNIPEYRRWLINKYGADVEMSMFLGSKEYFKPDANFYLDVIRKYLPKVKTMLKKKTFETQNYWTNLNRIERTYCDDNSTNR